ncbi:hypothetical protein [Nocardia carnea]|uniref:hypothetical protein n=1 Tax=Nocardia carnea TaxID=37328 RepID=UPI002457418D|nr:hypothetical protein [Nocardia carnea]
MSALPAEFGDLEPFSEWCLATEGERYAKRMASSMEDLQRFYDAITPRAEAALTYLDQVGLDDMPDDAVNLLQLLYSMIMVSFPVEVWNQPWIPDASQASMDCVIEPAP